MTHEETALRTKKAICDALKDLLQEKPFSKITVSELIRKCNINRKTFYYHFEDIYGLLRWMLEQETFEVVKNFDLLVDYQDAFIYVIDYVKENSYVLNCIYDSVGRDELKRFLYEDFNGIIKKLLQDIAAQKKVEIPASFMEFLSDFYTEAVAGMMINIFQNTNLYTRDQLIEYFGTIVHNSIPASIQAYPQNQKDFKEP